jgi:hypothetical protein
MELNIITVRDEEEIVMRLPLTSSQADRLAKMGVAVFETQTYIERVGINFHHYYTLVNTKELRKILPRR